MSKTMDQTVERLLKARADGDVAVMEATQEELQRLMDLQRKRQEQGRRSAAMQTVEYAREVIQRIQLIGCNFTPKQLVWLGEQIDALLLEAGELRKQIHQASGG